MTAVRMISSASRTSCFIPVMAWVDVAASIARPVKELKGFKRVTLVPGECAEVVFELDKETLSFFNAANEKVTEPGRFEVFVGTSSDDTDLLKGEFIYNN